MPEGKSPERCKASRDVQYALNRVYTAATRLKNDPTNLTLKASLIQKKENYREACKIATEKIIERDIEKMHGFQQVNTRKFFKATGLHMKFEGTATTMSHETIMKRIEDTEKIMNSEVKQRHLII